MWILILFYSIARLPSPSCFYKKRISVSGSLFPCQRESSRQFRSGDISVLRQKSLSQFLISSCASAVYEQHQTTLSGVHVRSFSDQNCLFLCICLCYRASTAATVSPEQLWRTKPQTASYSANSKTRAGPERAWAAGATPTRALCCWKRGWACKKSHAN